MSRREIFEEIMLPHLDAAHNLARWLTRNDQDAEDLVQEAYLSVLQGCIEALPTEFREVLVLRELEEMSYREITAVTGLAIGTVMSRLSRARKRLEECAARRKEAAG